MTIPMEKGRVNRNCFWWSLLSCSCSHERLNFSRNNKLILSRHHSTIKISVLIPYGLSKSVLILCSFMLGERVSAATGFLPWLQRGRENNRKKFPKGCTAFRHGLGQGARRQSQGSDSTTTVRSKHRTTLPPQPVRPSWPKSQEETMPGNR